MLVDVKKNYKQYVGSVLMITIGLMVIALGIFADQLGIGHGSKDFFGPAQWLMIGVGVSMVVIGIFSRQASFIIAVNLIVLLPALLLLDNLLYWTAPWLNKNLVQRMSVNAQTKYQLAHWDTVPVSYEGSVWFKPHYKKLISVDGAEKQIVYDAFGYRNPPN